MTALAQPDSRRDWMALACWPLAAVLLLAFVNAFPAWQALSVQLGGGARWLPMLALTAVLLPLALIAWRRRPWDWRLLLAAIICAALGLLATDPAFPAKRIHVAEYAVLALVLRRALCPWFAGWPLTLMAALLGLFAGMHDEMLQGLLPSRSYGLRDIGVDGLGALAGTLLGHGLGLTTGKSVAQLSFRRASLPALPLGVGLMLLLVPLERLAGYPIPPWTVAPLLAGAAVLLLLPDSDPAVRRLHLLLLLFTAPLALYPLLSHVPPLVFR
ncbi:VanZ family protein [Ferrovibrio sp. MS7]|uniref:VanZ family protein n=1 Tax=Ferrovibrio plantarum TaxID=3119164 RepID=UPI003135B0AC